jgi:hypothetical protein
MSLLSADPPTAWDHSPRSRTYTAGRGGNCDRQTESAALLDALGTLRCISRNLNVFHRHSVTVSLYEVPQIYVLYA